MSRYTLLTPAAAEAIEWVAVRLPDAAFDSFRAETEAALAVICARHGVTPDVLQSFQVRSYTQPRESGPLAVQIRGDYYAGEPGQFLYASGLWYAKCTDLKWRGYTMTARVRGQIRLIGSDVVETVIV